MSNDVRMLAFICICLGLIFVWLVAHQIVKLKTSHDRTVETKTNSLEGEK